jgi:hypothetical protein
LVSAWQLAGLQDLVCHIWPAGQPPWAQPALEKTPHEQQVASFTHRLVLEQPAGLQVRVSCLCKTPQTPAPQEPPVQESQEQAGG